MQRQVLWFSGDTMSSHDNELFENPLTDWDISIAETEGGPRAVVRAMICTNDDEFMAPLYYRDLGLARTAVEVSGKFSEEGGKSEGEGAEVISQADSEVSINREILKLAVIHREIIEHVEDRIWSYFNKILSYGRSELRVFIGHLIRERIEERDDDTDGSYRPDSMGSYTGQTAERSEQNSR